MDWQIPLSDIDLGEEEQAEVMKVLKSKWLTMGAGTQNFEQEFAGHHQTGNAIAVGNCTQALHMAIIALGISAGDEVIVPSLSFVATANAVLYTGATVRFAEITSLSDPTISPASIEANINKKTRAIIVMHYAGFPCDMPAIMALATKHNIPVIEDVAHAPGAWLNGKALGTFGIMGCFSFFSNKNLSTGEGGMIITDNAELAAQLRLLRSHGMTTLTWDRHKGHAASYDVVSLGYNNRIDEIRSAIGRVQLRKLAANNHKRLDLIEEYWTQLGNTPVELPFQQNSPRPLWGNTTHQAAGHIFPILLPAGTDRAAFMEALKYVGIQTSIHYPPIHTFSAFRAKMGIQHLPLTETYAEREITLPLYPGMTPTMVKIVSDAVKTNL